MAGGISVWGGMLSNQLSTQIQMAKMEAQRHCTESHVGFLTYQDLNRELGPWDRRLAMAEEYLDRVREDLERGVKPRIEKLKLELKVHESSHLPPIHKRGARHVETKTNP